ncbi:hypothetical protein Q8F55_008565 [Vanrija albida]|uniref:Protein CPL1-like domain-containing protein n=1 Tax=Vanrija albida TaxID=181172 RepID=A0ABR3PR84_9TREE
MLLLPLLALAALAAPAAAAIGPVYAGCVDAAAIPAGAREFGGVIGRAMCNAEKLLTSYIFQDCANTVTYFDPPITSPVSDVLQCFNFCNDNSKKQFWLFAIYYPGGRPGGPNTGPWCQCSTSTQYTRVTCSGTTAYNYNLERVASASWVVRREDKRRRGNVLGLCPGSKEACAVAPGQAGFECLDTRAELESCGGCRFGAVGVNSTAVGEDCTLTPGAVRGASTCRGGECVAFACLPGWTLVDGRCWEA